MPGFFLKLGTLAGPVDITGVVLPANTLTAAELQGVFKMSDGWYHALANETTFGSGAGATAGVASFTPFEVVFPASTETIQLLVDAASHKVYPTAALIATTTQGGAILRRAGRFAWTSATGTAPDLAQSAHQAMDALDLSGLTILKATTHYVGGPRPQDLHANLAVRHARFPMPGPASTGVPVAGLATATLAIDMLAIVDSPAE